MDENLDELLAWAEALAHRAGEIMRAYFDSSTADKRVEKKSDRTPVTIADKKINDLLIERVAADFPEHGVLGEEASAHENRKKLWVCDPIDGTAGFILGIPTAMFSLAFVVDGEPLAAVMYEPLLDKMFTAVKGKGARLNGNSLHVSDGDLLRDARLGVSSSTLKHPTGRAFFEALLSVGVKPVIVPGEVFRGGLTAAGKIDGHIFPGRSAHDVAAEKLIVEEAGGKVTDLFGHEQRYDGKIQGAIVSNGLIHQALVDQLAAFDPEKYLGY